MGNNKLTDTEAAQLISFLEELNERFGYDGCNDMFLPVTPENAELVRAVQLHEYTNDPIAYDGQEEAATLQEYRGQICTTNSAVLDYLISRVKDQYRLTNAEQVV